MSTASICIPLVQCELRLIDVEHTVIHSICYCSNSAFMVSDIVPARQLNIEDEHYSLLYTENKLNERACTKASLALKRHYRCGLSSLVTADLSDR